MSIPFLSRVFGRKPKPEPMAAIKCASGDTLIFRYDKDPTDECLQQLHDGLKEAFPGQKILLAPAHMSLHGAVAATANPASLRLEDLLETWRQRARRAGSDAADEHDPMGRRVIRMKALTYLICAEELERLTSNPTTKPNGS